MPPSLSISFQSQLIESVTSPNSIPIVTSLPDIFQILPSSTAKDDLIFRATEECKICLSICSSAVGNFPIDLLTLYFAPVIPVMASTFVAPLLPSSPTRFSASNPSSPANLLQTTPRAASETPIVAADISNLIPVSLADIELSCGVNNCVLTGTFPAIGTYSATTVTFQIGVLKMMMSLQNKAPHFIVSVRENNLAAAMSFAYPDNVLAGFWNTLCVEVSAGVLEDSASKSFVQLTADGCEFYFKGLIAPGPLSSYSNSAKCIASSASCEIRNLTLSEDGNPTWTLSPDLKTECFSLCICFKPKIVGLCSIFATLNASCKNVIVFSASKQCELNVVDCVSAKTTVSPVNDSMFVSVELQSRQVSVDLIGSKIEVPDCFSVFSDLSSGFNTRALLPGQLLGLGAKIGFKREGVSVGGSDCSGQIVLRFIPVHDVREDLGLLKFGSTKDADGDLIEDAEDRNAVVFYQKIELPCVTSTVHAEVDTPPFCAFGRQV